MGYVHVTDICQFIPPFMIGKNAGTWTPTESAGLISDVRTAEDTSFSLMIPLNLPGSEIALQGAKIVSIDVWYEVATGQLDSFDDVEFCQLTLSPDDDAVTAAILDSTPDSAHDTGDKRRAIDQHKMTVTVDDPAFIEKDTCYYLHLGANAAANTVFTLTGAQVNYTLRL